MTKGYVLRRFIVRLQNEMGMQSDQEDVKELT